jgi:hypothetical protein
MTHPAPDFIQGCPECGGELDYESGDPGCFDEPETVGVIYCLDCDYRQPDPDKWERLADMADDVYDREREGFGSLDPIERQLSEAD